MAACGACRPERRAGAGDGRSARRPSGPGHEMVGRVAALGPGVSTCGIGERVGIPWLGHTCGTCPYCASARENLCDAPVFTGYTRDGGYATHTIADASFAFRIPDAYSDVEAAPLLCAGLIGHRTLKLAGPGETIGIYGFGAAAHIVAQPFEVIVCMRGTSCVVVNLS